MTTSPARLCIDGTLTIHHAAEHWLALLALLEQQSVVEIDLSGVSEIDSAGVQLLLCAKRAARAQQKELHLLGHSAAVLDVLELLELSDFFADSTAVSAGKNGSN